VGTQKQKKASTSTTLPYAELALNVLEFLGRSLEQLNVLRVVQHNFFFAQPAKRMQILRLSKHV
jgi:hypothetical protein